jgi:hypothetical protein
MKCEDDFSMTVPFRIVGQLLYPPPFSAAHKVPPYITRSGVPYPLDESWIENRR